MNQNDFGNAAPTAAVAAAGGAGLTNLNSTEPLSPFDNNRRYVAPVNNNYDNYGGDYHDVYSQGGYSQEGYSQEYNNSGYPQQQATNTNPAEYGYYGGGGYDYNGAGDYQQKHYMNDITSPTSAGNMSETSGYHYHHQQQPSIDKPNVYESKPNEM